MLGPIKQRRLDSVTKLLSLSFLLGLVIGRFRIRFSLDLYARVFTSWWALHAFSRLEVVML